MIEDKFTTNTGDSITAPNAGWTFSGNTAKAFDAHVAKSIPLYSEGHDLVIKLSDSFLVNGSTCYEIGCSTGELSSKIATNNRNKNVKIIGIDIEPDMIEIAKSKCKPHKNVSLIADDIMNLELKKCDMVIMYYTLQFIHPKVRQQIVDRIYEALNWGGAFLLFEKVRANDARFQDIMINLYIDFKIENGFTANEIIAKSRSLKGVLEPFSTQGNLSLMERAGFVDIITLMKYTCFEGFLAIK